MLDSDKMEDALHDIATRAVLEDGDFSKPDEEIAYLRNLIANLQLVALDAFQSPAPGARS